MLQPKLLQKEAQGDILANCSYEDRPTGSPEQQQSDDNPFTFIPQVLRLHKDHEFFEDGDILRHMYLQDLYISEVEDKPTLSVSEFACHISGCTASFSTLEEYEHHYNSLHRHVCCSCRRSLPSARLLDIHIQEWHDSLFTILSKKQDMYQCLVEGCGQKFRTCKERKDHLIRIHKYPPDFRFDKAKKDRGSKEVNKQQQKDTAMEVVGDVCESEGVCEVMCNALSNQDEQEESMEMHVSGEEAAHNGDFSTASHNSDTTTPPIKPQYSYRVPSTVCFGHGSVRSFRGRRGRRK